MKSTVIHLTKTPAYIAARSQANRLQDELAKLDLEISALQAEAKQSATDNPILSAGIAALEDARPSPKLGDLMRRKEAIYYAIGPAHSQIYLAEQAESREYFKTEAPATLAALDGLIASLEGVLSACTPFKAIRERGESLGYDSGATGLPVFADKLYSDWVEGRLAELKRDADRLRDSLDTSLDNATLNIVALSDMPTYGLRCGDTGHIPARVAREYIRIGSAEVADIRSKLKKLLK